MENNLDPNSQGYTNALLKDLNDKFQVILEATQSTPQIQKDVSGLKDDIAHMKPKVEATFEAVGTILPI